MFQIAIQSLDAGQAKLAEELLRKALSVARQERDDLTRGSVLCCLGDLLMSQGRHEEALPFLEHLSLIERDDHSLDLEIDYAREMLEQLSPERISALA